jgi:plastocyanin
MTDPQGRQRKNRQSLLLPVAIPLGLLAVIGLVLYGYSRVLLSTSQTAATVIALITAASILLVATYVSGRPRVTGSLMFSMVAAVSGIAMVAGGIAVAIGPGKEAKPPVPAQTVSISASSGAASTGFDQKSLTWAADAPVNLVFDNKDSTAHNVYIAASKQSAGTPLFAGSNVNGGVQFAYQIAKLAVGTYFFFCNIHPAVMNGPLVVTPSSGNSVSVTAHNLAFNTDKIELTTGPPSSINFDNQDPGAQHNIGIYQDANFSTELFKGQIIAGPSSIVYKLPVLAAGTYYFKCDVHATMKGTVVVSAGAPPGPSASASASASSSAGGGASASP